MVQLKASDPMRPYKDRGWCVLAETSAWENILRVMVFPPLEAVLDAQRQILAEMRPGVAWGDRHVLMHRLVLTHDVEIKVFVDDEHARGVIHKS